MRKRGERRFSAYLLPSLFSASLIFAACSSETGTGGTGTGGASTSSTVSVGEGGCGIACSGTGGATGTGGTGGMPMVEPLYVGVGKQLINPTIVEKDWQDLNANNYWETNEPFTDLNNNGQFDATWIAGFGMGRPATGQNDDLEVRAIAFSKGGQTVVICILDAIGYFIDDMDLIRADPKVAALGVDHILIGSTHVHEGVDTIGLWGPAIGTTGLNADYQALTRERAAQAIVDAVNNLKPARMKIAQTKTVDPNTGSTLDYVNDTRDPIIYDPTVTIMQFTDEGNPNTAIATLVNWAAHPEYAGSKNNLLSADYVHWLREVVEKGVPSESIAGLGGTAVFVQGPLGGQIGPGGTHPIDANGNPISQAGLPKAEAAGVGVAKLALEALASSGVEVKTTELSYRETEMYGKVENLGYHIMSSLGMMQRKFYMYDETMPISDTNIPWVRTQAAYLQIGPVAMITLPGELHPELWVGGYDGSWSFGQQVLNETVNAPDLNLAPKPPYMRDLMLSNPGVQYTFAAGMTQDFLGYLVASFNYVLDPQNPYLQDAPGDHYEETNSIGPLVEEQVVHPIIELATPPTP